MLCGCMLTCGHLCVEYVYTCVCVRVCVRAYEIGVS